MLLINTADEHVYKACLLHYIVVDKNSFQWSWNNKQDEAFKSIEEALQYESLLVCYNLLEANSFSVCSVSLWHSALHGILY